MDNPSNFEIANFLLAHIDRITFLNNNSLVAEIKKRAASESADYILQNMEHAISFDDHLELLSYAMGKVSVDGLILEFGVHTGETVNHISAHFRDKNVYGFDSFVGLKEDWKGQHKMVAGSFDLGGIPPAVNANVNLVKGWFDETLPNFVLQSGHANIAFMHVDSDTYESAKTIFELLGNRLVRGSVIVFDEYFNYRGWKIGEYKAWQEYCLENKVAYEYLGFSIRGEQVAVKVAGVGR